MNSAVIISLVRTVVVPTVVGWALSFLVLLGVDDPTGSQRAAVTAVVALLWYLLSKFLSTVNSRWGVLLLIAAQPKYVETGEGTEEQAQDDMLKAVLRTVVPLAAGWAITQLVRLGITIDQDTAVVALQGVITSGYYGILRWIEDRGQRKVIEATATDVAGALPVAVPASATAAGVLLGSPAALTY